MAIRSAFIPKSAAPFCQEYQVSFQWSPGLNIVTRQRSMKNLHEAIRVQFPAEILEISSASLQEGGVELSAFNLPLTLASGESVSLECAYQGSKVFGENGPYVDLLTASSMSAKKDKRLTASPVTGYRLEGIDYPAEPQYAYYNWLYCRALQQNTELADTLSHYSMFTDIMAKADCDNCQARAAAVFEGLRMAGKLDVIDSFETFVKAVTPSAESAEDTAEEAAEESALSEEPAAVAVEETETAEAAEDAEAAEPSEPAETTETAEAAEADEEPAAPAAEASVSALSPEAFSTLINYKGLNGIINNFAKRLGLTGTCAERTDAARKRMITAYEQALTDSTLRVVDGTHLCFDIGEGSTVELIPNTLMPCGYRIFFHCDENAAPAPAPAEVPAEIPAETADIASAAELTPESYLTARGFHIIGKAAPEPRLLGDIAVHMASACSTRIGSGFFQHLRKHAQEETEQYYKFSDAAEANEKFAMYKLVNELRRFGLLRDGFVNQTRNYITYTVPQAHAVQSFLLGGWFEAAFMARIQTIAAELGKAYDLPVHIEKNLQLGRSGAPGVPTHELDVALTIGSEFIVCEAKTGFADYDRFRLVGEDLDILPDNLLLINSDLTSDEAAVIDFLYPYRVASVADLDRTLRSMISGALTKAGYRCVGSAPDAA